MGLFRKKNKKTRTVFVIKHPTEMFLVRGLFFKKKFTRRDINMPRSDEFEWAKKIALKYISPVDLLLQVGEQGHLIQNVRLGVPAGLLDIRLVIIHVQSDHVIANDQACTVMSDHPPLDRLLRRKVDNTNLLAAQVA
ncbi:MAG: hypothetical protein ACI9SY_000281 [Candidatus Paceibacteria bacterium]|jgi:hypothetical protein